ncbi:MAG: glycosyl hydrolase family 18 protein [Candidatus Lernaella stagnicola]|nr:glycosyl hydrolase family 18 protein [Candidatus Lernaella stagnicola]
MKRLWLALLLLSMAAGFAFAGIHQLEHNAYRTLVDPSPVYVDDVPPLAPAKAGDEPYVAGFYPYWGDDIGLLQYDVLDEVIYFGADLNGQGDITSLHGWPRQDLVAAAHAEGTRVTLAVICFSATDMNQLLPSATNRANAIDQLVEAVNEGGADGVNVDFEGLPVAQKQNFVTFVQQLKAGLQVEDPDAIVSVDTPAVDWSGAFDFDALAAHGRLFIMAYDYHWRTGDPGPVAPLLGSDFWGQYAYDWTLDDYQTYITPYTLERVLLGVPFYGYDWPSAGSGIPGTATGSATAYGILQAWDRADAHGGGQWDAPSSTAYAIFYEGGWRQLWYEDLDSLADKLDYAATREVGGVGFWTAYYAADNQDIWDLVAEYKYGSPGDDDDDDDDDNDDDDDDSGGCGQVVF